MSDNERRYFEYDASYEEWLDWYHRVEHDRYEHPDVTVDAVMMTYDDEAKPGINCPLDYGVKIFAEGRHVEVAVCVGENGDVFVGHGFILPVTIALGGGCKSG